MGCQGKYHGMSIRMRISDLERDLELCSLGFNLRIEYADIIDKKVTIESALCKWVKGNLKKVPSPRYDDLR